MGKVQKDPDVQDEVWSVSGIEKTKKEYAEHLASFLQWASPTLHHVFENVSGLHIRPQEVTAR
ncbi:MAG TPA: hypothetical protein VK503_06905 [Candidatus Bathyarchaeia archaeon]|nr:hypothetical protein [Candidatus Bathyarchaeia archaeon]